MAEVMKLTTKGGQGYLHNRKALDCVCLFLELLGNVHNRDKPFFRWLYIYSQKAILKINGAKIKCAFCRFSNPRIGPKFKKNRLAVQGSSR